MYNCATDYRNRRCEMILKRKNKLWKNHHKADKNGK